jgi:hypothetical protein
MKISDFLRDEEREEGGVWVEIAEGLEIKIAALGSVKFEQHLRRISKRHRVAARRGVLSEETAEDLMKQAMARHVVLDWRNLQDEDGSDVPYSEAAALEYLRSSRKFFRLVRDIATDEATFRADAEEASTGE